MSGKNQSENVYSCTAKMAWFLSVYVDEMKMGGKKNNLKPMWDILIRQVDLGERTSLSDHVYLRCTQHEFKPNLKIV